MKRRRHHFHFFPHNFFGKVHFFIFFGIYPVSGWLGHSRHHQPSLLDRLSTFFAAPFGIRENKKKQGIVDQPLFFLNLVIIPLLLFFLFFLKDVRYR